MKFCAGDFSLENAPQQGRPVDVDRDQIETLIENNQVGDSWHTQNIQINKVIGENEKKNISFILQKKTKPTFWPTQYFMKN